MSPDKNYIGTSDFFDISCLDINYNLFAWKSSTTQCHKDEFLAFAGWSQTSISFVTSFCNERIFGGLGKLTRSMFLTKTFNAIPSHTQLIIDFKLVKINFWNGEQFEVQIDNLSRFSKNLVSSNGLSNLCNETTNFISSEMIESINIQLDHTSSSLEIKMQGYLTSSQGNANWGIKDFKVYIINNCKEGCLTCDSNNGTICLSCPIFAKLINDKCICAEHFFMKTNDFVHCAICHYSCNSCNGPLETNCLSCFFDHTLSEGKCIASKIIILLNTFS